MTANLHKSRRRVVVGMSGGVDSTVAAAMLVEQGFEVIGITIKTYDYDRVGGAEGDSSCCSLDGINDARAVCGQLGIPHYVLNFTAPFNEHVIQPFIDEYLAGNTPNPCVLCNKFIKWEELIRRALAIGADAVAMGHYARLRHDPARGRYWVARGKDPGKDQSYALWYLSQDSLSRTLFPLADYTKEDVRRYARERGLKNAGKSESYEICFIPDDDYARFLKERRPDLVARSRGEIVMGDRVLGEHGGYPFYTIGQRRGLNLAVGEPLFVTRIDAAAKRIHVGSEKDLLYSEFRTRDVNLMKLESIIEPIPVLAKIRYRDEGAPATLHPGNDGGITVRFDHPRRAITPGQSTAWYQGDDLLGGAIIDEVVR